VIRVPDWMNEKRESTHPVTSSMIVTSTFLSIRTLRSALTSSSGLVGIPRNFNTGRKIGGVVSATPYARSHLIQLTIQLRRFAKRCRDEFEGLDRGLRCDMMTHDVCGEGDLK
jgi:hypothetical protein